MLGLPDWYWDTGAIASGLVLFVTLFVSIFYILERSSFGVNDDAVKYARLSLAGLILSPITFVGWIVVLPLVALVMITFLARDAIRGVK